MPSLRGLRAAERLLLRLPATGTGHYLGLGLSRLMPKSTLACEGLFGRLKNEFFYHRDWRGVTLEEFMERLDAYLAYYNEGRPKESLGWMTPAQKRAAFYEGVVA